MIDQSVEEVYFHSAVLFTGSTQEHVRGNSPLTEKIAREPVQTRKL